MPLDNTDLDEASENTRLMDAHVATTGSGDVTEGQNNRKRKPRTTNRIDNRDNNSSHVNYGSV